MGIQSSNSNKISFEQYLSTKDGKNNQQGTQKIMNEVLKYMLQTVHISDFVQLSDATYCKKYIIFMADSIDKALHKINISTDPNKPHQLYFESIDNLIHNSQSTRSLNCIRLAYFYVRIFQIFGAIALSLRDDTVLIESVKSTRPGEQLHYIHGGNQHTQIGGNIEFIHDYINNDKSITTTGYFYTKYNQIPGNEVLFKNLDDNHGIFLIKSNNSSFFLYFTIKSISQFTSQFTTSISNNNRFIVTFDKIIYKSPNNNDIPIFLQIKPFQVARNFMNNTFTIDDKDLVETLNSFFYSNITKLLQNIPSTTLANPNKPINIIDRSVNESIRKYDKFDINRTIVNLRHPTKGHCIARALQLLTEKMDKTYTSQICKTSFKVSTTSNIQSKLGLVLQKDSVKDSPGLSSVEILFWDKIEENTPKLSISNTGSYTNFLKKLQILYYDRSPQKFKEFKDIKNRRNQEICSSRDSEIKISSNKINHIKNDVNKLIDRHIQHSRECIGILNKLFLIDKNAQGNTYIQIHPTLLNGGILALNTLNEMSRNTLINYYIDCEKLYINGIKSVIL